MRYAVFIFSGLANRMHRFPMRKMLVRLVVPIQGGAGAGTLLETQLHHSTESSLGNCIVANIYWKIEPLAGNKG